MRSEPPSFATVTAEGHTGLITELLRRRAASPESLSGAAWNDILAVSALHGLSPLVYRRVQGAVAAAPVAVTRELRERYLSSAAANMRLFHELGAILRALRAADVPVIPLKGACLAEAVYGDIALRPMADLDLLVKPADLPLAVEALRQLGYDSRPAVRPGRPTGRVPGHAPHAPARRRDGGAALDVGHAAVRRANRWEGTPGIWERSAPATIAGVPSRMLSPEDLLLHLCMHASVHHRFADVGLKAFVDITEVVRHYQRRARLVGVCLTREPVGRVERHQDGADAGAGVDRPSTCPPVCRHDWMARIPTGRPSSGPGTRCSKDRPAELASEFARLESGGGAAGKLSALRTAAFPPRAVLARLYGVPGDSWRIFAWYPYRLWDLFSRYRGALWKLLRSDKAFVDDTRREARLREFLGWS